MQRSLQEKKQVLSFKQAPSHTALCSSNSLESIYEVKRKSNVYIYIYIKALNGQNCSYAAFTKAYHNFRAVLLIIISYCVLLDGPACNVNLILENDIHKSMHMGFIKFNMYHVCSIVHRMLVSKNHVLSILVTRYFHLVVRVNEFKFFKFINKSESVRYKWPYTWYMVVRRRHHFICKLIFYLVLRIIDRRYLLIESDVLYF